MKTRVLGSFSLCMISISAVLGLRGLPVMATLGFQLITFYTIALITFLLPSTLICAELATSFPENAGIYRWVKVAFGDRVGFLAIWMEWTNNIIGYPTMLATIVATIAYIGLPSLAQNPQALFWVMISILWLTTLLNLLGIQVSSQLNIIGALIGTILTGVFIIILGVIYTHHHGIFLPTWHSFVPSLDLTSLAIFVSTLSAYSGMQVTAFHAKNVKNPARDYPKGLLIAALVVFLISVLAALSISLVIHSSEINLLNGVIESFAHFFAFFHLTHLTPLLAFLIALSGVANLSAWLIGPARGFREALHEHGFKKLATLNRFEMPSNLLIVQSVICSLLASVFLWMPSLKAAFWFLLALTSQFTILMYILLFASAIRLRYSHRHIKRPFAVPFGLGGMWLLAGMGIIVSVAGFLLGLFPPGVIEAGNPWRYALNILMGDSIVLALPLILLILKK